MINEAVDILQKELEQHLQQFTPGVSTELTELLDLNGTTTPDGKIGITVVSIEEERVNKAQNPYFVNDEGQTVKRNPELHLNLFVMFSAFPSDSSSADYLEALKKLSQTIGFFQGKKVFTPENSPQMAQDLDTIYLDIHNQNAEQQNDLWGKFNMNYVPSICYRVRLVTVQNNNSSAEQPAITASDATLKTV